MTDEAEPPRIRAATLRGETREPSDESEGKVNCTMARRKKRSAWGSLDQAGPNKWVIRYTANTPEGRKRKSKTFYGTRKEADLERARLRVAHASDKPVPTIGRAYEMWWLPWMRRRVADGSAKQRTLDQYAACWRNHVAPAWASVPVDSVRPMDVQAWLLGLSKETARNSVVVLRKVLDFAVRYEVVPSNKLRMPYEMPTRERKSRQGTLSLAQADDALAAVRGSLVEGAFILACFGGLRVGEACGVRCEDVSLARAHGVEVAAVRVARMMPNKGCEPFPDGVLKNAQSVRTAAIPGEYGARLAELARNREGEGVEWLSHRGDGLPLNTAAAGYLWSAFPAARDVPLANLRKSWRTFAQYDWKVDHDTLELLMGHKLPGVTGQHYLKPRDEDLIGALAEAYAAFVEGRRV